jgi:hypothetical protein
VRRPFILFQRNGLKVATFATATQALARGRDLARDAAALTDPLSTYTVRQRNEDGTYYPGRWLVTATKWWWVDATGHDAPVEATPDA